MNRIIAIPKGSLAEATRRLFQKVGIRIDERGRKYLAEVKGTGLFTQAYITRAQTIPLVVVQGKAEWGITGLDCLVESGLECQVEVITRLNYSKSSKTTAAVVVFGKRKEIIDTADTRVFSEFPNLARRIFRNARIELSPGSTESEVASGIFDYGVCVMESGKTLLDNDLVVVSTIMDSPVVLIARNKTQEVESFGSILQSALTGDDYRYLKMNVDESRMDDVLEILPALKSPDIVKLADGNYSVGSLVRLDGLADLMIALKAAGAMGIFPQAGIEALLV
jgi:ATP phosphoribosyltransferase